MNLNNRTHAIVKASRPREIRVDLERGGAEPATADPLSAKHRRLGGIEQGLTTVSRNHFEILLAASASEDAGAFVMSTTLLSTVGMFDHRTQAMV